MEFGTLEAIFGCVSAGLGITLLPRALIGPVWRSGRVGLHSLPREEAMVTTVFIHRREAHLSSALRAFLEFARTGGEVEVAARVPNPLPLDVRQSYARHHGHHENRSSPHHPPRD
jgi:DNA-binding transcriptional LysR family regulator